MICLLKYVRMGLELEWVEKLLLLEKNGVQGN